MALSLSVVAAPSAHAANADGRYFPCAEEFAKRVAINSGFAQLAGTENPNYRNPDFWLVLKAICGDFDRDGSDEMAFTLEAMGGHGPWAFFEVPMGRADLATFSHPTYRFRGNYPNHELTLVRRDDFLMIRDQRIVYGDRDARCCPTKGNYFRWIGFVDGRYKLLRELHVKPPPVRRRRLGAKAARIAAATFLAERFGTTWTERVGGRIRCRKRLSFSVRRCEAIWGIGDAAYIGRIRLAAYRRGRNHFARVRYRVRQIDEYCVYVYDRSPRQCDRFFRGRWKVSL